MNILIRVDSSIKIGTGHMMRCLTLAGALKAQDHTIHFVCRDLKGNITQLVEKQGHSLYLLPKPNGKFVSQSNDITHAEWLEVQWRQDSRETSKIIQKIADPIDWLIVDNYALDYRWESSLRYSVKNIMVIDDVADRKHDCDMLLDQNYHPNSNERYLGLIPFITRTFLGPKYAILRPEFLKERQNLHQRNSIINNILIFFGGVDPTNETGKAIKAIEILDRSDLKIDVIIGSSNPNKSGILDQCQRIPYVTCHGYVKNIARFMAIADLAIGAGGTTAWERCCLGLPSLVEILAGNQTIIAKGIEKVNAGCNLGVSQDITAEYLAEKINDLIVSKTKLLDYSKAAFNLVDGKGASRVVKAIQTRKIKLRKARQFDCKLLWHWANDPEVRQSSFNSDLITFEEHLQWFEIKLKDNQGYIFIAEDEKNIPIGQIRFDLRNGTATVNYSVQDDYRGFGIGETIVRVGIQKIIDFIQQPIVFQSKVKIKNIVSQKIFNKIGFLKANKNNDCICFELER